MRVVMVLLFLCLMHLENLQSQEIPHFKHLKGTVLDSIHRTPLPYSYVSVFGVESTSPLGATLTEVDGTFSIQEIQGSYFKLVISFVGYKKLVLSINADTTTSIIELGDILLSPATNQLKEIQIIAQKGLIVYDIDKITYNVQADPTHKSSRAIDMLRKVPLLTIDADDNIKLKGSSNYKVLINGKESSILAKNVKDVARSMPASSIKSIEVMTVPPARYDAEGVGGIINIVTHKPFVEGYNGSVNFSGSIPKGYHTGGFLTALIHKIGINGYGGYSLTASPNSRIALNRTNRSQDTSHTVQQGRKDYESSFSYLGSELSYQLDSLNFLSLNYNLDVSNGKNFYFYRTEVSDQQKNIKQAFSQNNDSFNEWLATDIGADFQRTSSRDEQQLLTISFKYKSNRDNASSDFKIASITNYQNSLNKTDNNGLFRERTFQVDYVYPLNKFLAELGIKGIFRKNHSNYQYEQYNPEKQTYVNINSLSNIFHYRQNIYAAYTSISMTGERWSLKAGGRLESTSIEANFRTLGNLYEQSFNNLIPNIAFLYETDSTSSLRIAYSQRIERPGLYYLNPYPNIIDPKNISSGNPNLVPTTTNSLELSYNMYRGDNSFNASLYYNFANNSIQYYTTIGLDAIARSTYGNIGRNHYYGLFANGNITIAEKLNISINGDISHIQLSSKYNHINIRSTGYTYNVFTFAGYKLAKAWHLSANIGYNSQGIVLQGRTAPYTFHSFSITREILKDSKAILGFNVSNPFQKERRWYNETKDYNFSQLQESYVLNRWFSLSFNYKFGKLESDIKRSKRGIENNDIKAVKKRAGEL